MRDRKLFIAWEFSQSDTFKFMKLFLKLISAVIVMEERHEGRRKKRTSYTSHRNLKAALNGDCLTVTAMRNKTPAIK